MDSYYVEPNFLATTFVSIISGVISAIIDTQYKEKGLVTKVNKKTTYASFMIKKMSDIKKHKPYIKASNRFNIALKEWEGTNVSKKSEISKHRFIFSKLCEIRKQNPEIKANDRIKMAKRAWEEYSKQ
jgi:hypothetical protein